MRIGIFLSIFNVHLNRAPCDVAGDCLALFARPVPERPETRRALENENTWIGLEEQSPPHRRLMVRQVSGAIARRIVCNLRPGETLGRGQKFGMIKLGSRTELILAQDDDLSIEVRHWRADPGRHNGDGQYRANRPPTVSHLKFQITKSLTPDP